MAETKKWISSETHLMGLALFSMARDHYLKAKEFETALAELLEYEDESYCGCISDQFFEDNGSFARGLKNENIGVRAPPKKPR
jgi:hypothetical protein